MSKEKIDATDIISMIRCLEHRGPDSDDFLITSDATVALGHTRLSVIDLSVSANQPMFSLDGKYSIIFNGEIYNYKTLRKELLDLGRIFVTQSDTEVILQGFIQWGSGICQRLEGMFAFAVFDQQANVLFLCRDGVGKKPLYFHQSRGLFAFASEIKALLRHRIIQSNIAVNYGAMYTFLHLGYIPEPDTSYTSIKKFPSGHFAYVKSDGSMHISVYRKPVDNLKEPVDIGPPEAIARVKSVLMDAVSKRLVADVPVGAFLSGGTDSSLVVAMASRLKSDSRLKTFSIGFQKSQFDETTYARKVAQILKTDHSEYILEEEEAINLLEQYLIHFDEPFADTSAIPTMLVSRLARKHVTVALTGDGADELFLGYGRYDLANRLDQFWVHSLRSAAYGLQRFGTGQLKRIGFLLEDVTPTEIRSHIFSQEQCFFTRSEIRMMATRSQPVFESLNYIDPDGRKLKAAEKQALFDIQLYLKDDLLVKVDRASMLYGLECRCPFLDDHVISMAMSLPYDMKKKGGVRKWILKEILKEYLPEDLVNRPKWGFGIPLLNWMKNDLAYLIDRYLNQTMVNDVGIVSYPHVQRLKRLFSQGTDFLYNRLWVLIAVHKWLHENDR